MGSRVFPIQVNIWPHLEGARRCSPAGFHVTAPLSSGLRAQAAASATTYLVLHTSAPRPSQKSLRWLTTLPHGYHPPPPPWVTQDDFGRAHSPGPLGTPEKHLIFKADTRWYVGWAMVRPGVVIWGVLCGKEASKGWAGN